jgi:hypothetical protein
LVANTCISINTSSQVKISIIFEAVAAQVRINWRGGSIAAKSIAVLAGGAEISKLSVISIAVVVGKAKVEVKRCRAGVSIYVVACSL